MGLGRVELPTSRLSGVRSNQLSYRPLPAKLRATKASRAPGSLQREFTYPNYAAQPHSLLSALTPTRMPASPFASTSGSSRSRTASHSISRPRRCTMPMRSAGPAAVGKCLHDDEILRGANPEGQVGVELHEDRPPDHLIFERESAAVRRDRSLSFAAAGRHHETHRSTAAAPPGYRGPRVRPA
jgi:hypothetical protein